VAGRKWSDGEKHISGKYVVKEGDIVTNLFRPYIILLLLQFLVCMRWGDRRMIGAAGTQVCEVIWK
jgi:hypothetical protein